MDAQYVQATFYDEEVDAADLFPPAQSLGAECLSDDIASYFSFDDTINGSGATTPNYYPPSRDSEMADEAVDSEQRDVKGASSGKNDSRKVDAGNKDSKPKRKYSASVIDEPVGMAVAVAPVVQAVETKASKRAKKLAQIDIPAAVISSPTSPFSLSPSFSSGSVSPAPSMSSSNSSHHSSPSPPPHNSNSSALCVEGEVDVGALLAESALKKSRLARKAELARLGRKRKNETIEKYSAQVDKLQVEMRQLKAQMDKERKAHKRALKAAIESGVKAKGGAGSDGDDVMVKVEQHNTAAAVVAPVKQPTEAVMAASQTALAALAAFCKQRDVDTATTTAACSALLNHMHSMAVSHTAVDGYRVALQRAAVTADSVSALVARFFASYSLQAPSCGVAVAGEAVDAAALWQAMWQQPRAQVTEQQVDELNAWMKSMME